MKHLFYISLLTTTIAVAQEHRATISGKITLGSNPVSLPVFILKMGSPVPMPI